ncbi:MAG: extracellular solute-binding protein [Bacillota bacterium]|jgi:multiple sugar transport system substrate-binding protein|nr:extracellular solute-binding protein [Bacillota bacterium]
MKLYQALSLTVFAVTMLSGCGGNKPTEPKKEITYVNWNLGTIEENNLERQMIKAYEEKANVKIKIIENINTAAYEDAIAALASKGNMPDVFMLTNLTFGLENKYLLNIKSYADEDAEWAKIPAPIEEATHIFDGIYAIPFAMHMMGFFVNNELLEQYNLEPLGVDFTFDQFKETVVALKNPTEHVMGLNLEGSIFEWYPSVLNNDLQWFTFDGTRYNLDSPEFATAMAETSYFRANKMTFDSLLAEERVAMGYEDVVDFWNDGKLGLRWGQTYEIPDINANSSSFSKSFIGTPGGRTPIIGDYLGISPTCKEPELAYDFARFMSFGTEGINKRIELDTTGKQFSSLPLTTDQAVIDNYFAKPRMDGLKDVFAKINNGIVEGVKIIPGYVRSRWNQRVGSTVTITVNGEPITNPKIGEVIDQCWLGNLTWADYASGLNDVANTAYQTALNRFKDLYTPTSEA